MAYRYTDNWRADTAVELLGERIGWMQVDGYKGYERVFALGRPTPMGPFAQIIHAAVQVGLARGALAETISCVRAHARPFFELSIEHGYEDPHTIHAVGDVSIRVHAADALLARAGRLLDAATENPTKDTVAAASIAVAEVKALGTEVAQLAATKLIELGGARSTLEKLRSRSVLA